MKKFMTKNIFLSSARYIVVEFLWDIIYFPVWWYTKGLARVANFCLTGVVSYVRNIGFVIWLKSMSKPMFGDYSKEGRIISFFMRIIVLIYKVINLLVRTVVFLAIFLLWVLLPALFIYYILYQIFKVPFIF